MELRRTPPRRQTSKEDLRLEHDTAASEGSEQLHPDLYVGTDHNEDETVERDCEPYSLNRFANSFRQCVLFVAISTFIILLSSWVALSECDRDNLTVKCKDSLQNLYEEFPQHKSFWKAVNVSCKICAKSEQPGVTLVLHNGPGSISECIVNQTATHLSKLIGVSESGEYCYVDGRNAHHEFQADLFLAKMMEQRKNPGVIVFNLLEEMDTKIVKNLHFICDRDPNFSDKSIVILLLKVEKQTFTDLQLSDLYDLAYDKLAKLWERNLGERFMPIIGRITNNIGLIDENIETKCP